MDTNLDPNMDFTLWMKRMEEEEALRDKQQKEGIIPEPWLPPDTAECWCATDNPWHCIAMKLDVSMKDIIDQNMEPCECKCHPLEEEKPNVGTKPSGLRGARRR